MYIYTYVNARQRHMAKTADVGGGAFKPKNHTPTDLNAVLGLKDKCLEAMPNAHRARPSYAGCCLIA